MREIFLVGAGGFAGSVARYLLSGFATRASGASRFPFGTLTVNLLGCLLIGILAGIAEQVPSFTPAVRLLLITGVLGGFTTYSAFAFESYFLGKEGLYAMMLLNIAGQVVTGLLAVWVGHAMAVALAK